MEIIKESGRIPCFTHWQIMDYQGLSIMDIIKESSRIPCFIHWQTMDIIKESGSFPTLSAG